MSSEERKRPAPRALVERILEGEARAPRDRRRAAFDNRGLEGPLQTLTDKVAQRPAHVTDQDIAAVKASGLTEDEIFELVVCAAVGQATRQYEVARRALAEAIGGRGAGGHAPRDSR